MCTASIPTTATDRRVPTDPGSSATRRGRTGRQYGLATLVALALLLCAGTAAATAALVPARHGDFGHYTFALTWQPGFCADGSCATDQNHQIDIGLHGLWASRPQALIARGISAPQWWSRGCDYYHHSDAAPQLDAATRQRLRQVMPQLPSSLLTHEYDKHVQCFGFDATRFFQAALDLRKRVVASPFGRWLRDHAGRDVTRHDLLAAFDRDFHTDKTWALQLRCSGPSGRRYLSQLWFTIPRQHLAEFPRGNSLMNAPIAQHNCPARFRLPAWS